MRTTVNVEIALTHLLTRRKQTIVAALGVMIGVAIYIFMNSMMTGFDRSANESFFKTMPHIRIYKEDVISRSILPDPYQSTTPVIINPKIATDAKNLINPFQIVAMLKKQPDVVAVAPNVTVNIFYNNGKSQLSGIASGINVPEQNKMFNIESFLVEGNINDLQTTQNGIILGTGIAASLNIQLHDNITVTSSKGVFKVMKVVGFFQSNNSLVDKSKSYINIAAAQQLLQAGPTYVTDIYVNIKNPDISDRSIPAFSRLTGYAAEDWKKANEAILSAYKARRIMGYAISLSILLVAGFGIFNILNMSILEKMNDIAILKATGFSGKDVVRIFVSQAVFIGVAGVLLGIALNFVLVRAMSNVYIGGDTGYFPIRLEPLIVAEGILFGLIITFIAGYIPSRKAANVDPVRIFRK
ncbi:MAG: ABC transporter permease [Sphingobacteriales bacterium]|jgi:lipoprotein-releasing system permease protein|nr:ABC transporter permease [Sphingobacteriales bacterium]